MRLEQVANIPCAIGSLLIHPTGFRSIFRFFEAEAEAERGSCRNCDRSPPFADLCRELRDFVRVSPDDRFFRPQGIEPGVMQAVERSLMSATTG